MHSHVIQKATYRFTEEENEPRRPVLAIPFRRYWMPFVKLIMFATLLSAAAQNQVI
jgi:hypothetical protein